MTSNDELADRMYSGESKELAKMVAPISPEAWAAYRSVFRSLGQRHWWVDRWRHDLKWNVPDHVIADWVAEERAKLSDGGRKVH